MSMRYPDSRLTTNRGRILGTAVSKQPTGSIRDARVSRVLPPLTAVASAGRPSSTPNFFDGGHLELVRFKRGKDA